MRPDRGGRFSAAENRPGQGQLRAVPDQLLTPEQAATLMAVKPVTVRSWMANGRLPRVKLGRCVRVPAEAVAAFIAANTHPAVR